MSVVPASEEKRTYVMSVISFVTDASHALSALASTYTNRVANFFDRRFEHKYL
jgi:hypothetical protein